MINKIKLWIKNLHSCSGNADITGHAFGVVFGYKCRICGRGWSETLWDNK